MLLKLKRPRYMMQEIPNTGISAKSVLLWAVAMICKHSDLFTGNSFKRAVTEVTSAFAHPQAQKFKDSVSGGLNLFVNLFLMKDSVHTASIKTYLVVSSVVMVVLARNRFFGSQPKNLPKKEKASEESGKEISKSKTTQPVIPDKNDSFPGIWLVFVAVLGGCITAAVAGKIAPNSISQKLIRSSIKWTGTILEPLTVIPQLSMHKQDWNEGNRDTMALYCIFFKALYFVAHALLLTFNGKVFASPAVEDTSSLAKWPSYALAAMQPLIRTSIANRVRRTAALGAAVLHIPFFMRFVRHQWMVLLVCFGCTLSVCAYLEVPPATLLNVELFSLENLSQTGVAYMVLLEVMLAIWVIFFSGSVGIFTTAVCINMLYHLHMGEKEG